MPGEWLSLHAVLFACRYLRRSLEGGGELAELGQVARNVEAVVDGSPVRNQHPFREVGIGEDLKPHAASEC